MKETLQNDTTSAPSFVYILHYETKLGHAQHYCGWTSNLDKRLSYHIKNKKQHPALTRAFALAGIKILAVSFAAGTRNDERRVKKTGHVARYCEACSLGIIPNSEPVKLEGKKLYQFIKEQGLKLPSPA